MDVSPPTMPPPSTKTASLSPSFPIWTLAPSSLRLVSNGSTGRFSIEPLNTKVEGPFASAATGTMKRNVAPDSPQSIGSFAPLSILVPSMVQQLSATVTFAPKAVTARSVAWVSSDKRGPETLDSVSYTHLTLPTDREV